jgi:hypothetical protein
MKKNTLIRNDSPHAVKMNEGSNVAERRVKKVAAVKEDEPKPSVSLLVKPTPEITPVPVKAPKRSAVKPRPSVRLKTAPPAPPAPAPLPIQAVKPLAAITAAPILDEAALWEQDNPVKSRLAQLRTRNALLDEQLQRLKTPFHARGKKS